MGILIGIDGVDASGKETQSRLLEEHLIQDGVAVRRISFPAYDQPCSVLVKLYLEGRFGSRPEDVNAYAASTFFAADRFATYKMDWKADYEAGTVILADRYVSSNMIHQAGKIVDLREKEQFLDWIFDLEYKKFELPQPDLTVFLDMPPEYGAKLMEDRPNKIDGSKELDIHEKNVDYLKKSYNNAVAVADRFGWYRINCVANHEILPVQQIHEQVYRAVKEKLN